MNKKKAFLIARVSDIEQRKALPAQIQRLEKYSEENNLDATLVDFDESAYKDNRTKFAKLIKQIENYPDQCIVVFDKIDRYSRDSSQEEVRILNQLRVKGKIEIHFPYDNLTVTKDSPAADLFRLGIGLALAKYYSDSIRDNVKRRFEQMVNDKQWPGKAPIGYTNHRISEKETTIIVDKDRAKFIVKAFELRSQGMPVKAITKLLRNEGLQNNTKISKPISCSHVSKILYNPFYYGTMRYMGKLHPHKYEPIISKRLFDKCQLVNDERANHPTKDTKEDYTFNKLLKCGQCGCSVSSYKAKGIVYMRCTKARGPCSLPHLKEKDVLDQVTKVVKSLQLREKEVQNVIKDLKNHHDNQQEYFSSAIVTTRKEYDSIQRKLKMAYQDRLEGSITLDEYNEFVKDLKTRQQELDEQLVSLTKDDKSFMITASYLLEIAQKAATLFESSKPALKAKLLGFLFANLKMDGKIVHYNLKSPFDMILECSKTLDWQGWQESNPRPLVLETNALAN